MTLAQSKKLSQLTADNAQWEDRQLLRSGAVRGTEVQTEFDNEEERKVILLVHGMPKYYTWRINNILIFNLKQLLYFLIEVLKISFNRYKTPFP